MEIDSLQQRCRDLEDVAANLNRKKELLVRENEKLKVETRANRSSVDGRMSNASGNAMIPKLGMSLANAVSSSFQGT